MAISHCPTGNDLQRLIALAHQHGNVLTPEDFLVLGDCDIPGKPPVPRDDPGAALRELLASDCLLYTSPSPRDS